MHQYYIFIISAILLNITPGPDMAYILSKTISNGKVIGFFTVLGVCSGALIHVLLVSLGITLLITKNITLFNGLKILGGLYLIYLGSRSIRSFFIKSEINTIANELKMDSKTSYFQAYKEGIFVDLFNPKVAIFFLSYLPAFVVNSRVSESKQLFILGVTVVFIAFIIELLLVFLSEHIRILFKNRNSNLKIFDIVIGLTLIFIGISVIPPIFI
jgi:threonine/homoserine/homoserine lactone efflux protein